MARLPEMVRWSLALALLVSAAFAVGDLREADACFSAPPIDPHFDGPSKLLRVIDARTGAAPSDAYVRTMGPYAEWTVPPDGIVALPQNAVIMWVAGAGYEFFDARKLSDRMLHRIVLRPLGEIEVRLDNSLRLGARTSIRVHGVEHAGAFVQSSRHGYFEQVSIGRAVVALWRDDGPIAWASVDVRSGALAKVQLSRRGVAPPATITVERTDGTRLRDFTLQYIDGADAERAAMVRMRRTARGTIRLGGAFVGTRWRVVAGDDNELCGQLTLVSGRQSAIVDKTDCAE